MLLYKFRCTVQWVTIYKGYIYTLVAQTVKNLLAMQETQVRSLGWEDPLEKEMATHSSILVWKIPWTEEPGGLQSMGLQRIRHNSDCETITFHFFPTLLHLYLL